MAHVHLDGELPGITGLLASYPQTGGPLGILADALLQRDDDLSRAERELVAAFVSRGNDCEFCTGAHGAVARSYGDLDAELVGQVLAGHDLASVPGLTPRLRALLTLAGQVRLGGQEVETSTVAQARDAGATDLAIHDTVLIAAAFCMFNRYVDGLRTAVPPDPSFYDLGADLIRRQGYGWPTAAH